MNATFRMDKFDEIYPEYYIELTHKGTKLEMGTGWPDSIRRTSVTRLTREQAHILARALQTLADTLDDAPTPDAQA